MSDDAETDYKILRGPNEGGRPSRLYATDIPKLGEGRNPATISAGNSVHQRRGAQGVEKMKYQQHPLSAAFPAMPESEINDLAESIKKKGLKHPIALYQGMVLDGWHRYLACEIAGVSPRFYDYNGSDPVGEARALNLHRRHILNAGQRALIEVRLSEWAPRGKPAKGEMISPLATVQEMATNAETSDRVVQQAKRVEESGTKEVKAAALSGDIQIAKAAAVAKKPKREQAKALKEAKEKKPKLPKKPSAVKRETDDSRTKELGDSLQDAHSQIEKLEALVESLKKDDKDKEIAKWHLKWDQLEGRLRQCIGQKNEAETQAKNAQAMLKKIRTALKVQSNSEILQALRQ